jgi:hypothetical protein
MALPLHRQGRPWPRSDEHGKPLVRPAEIGAPAVCWLQLATARRSCLGSMKTRGGSELPPHSHLKLGMVSPECVRSAIEAVNRLPAHTSRQSRLAAPLLAQQVFGCDRSGIVLHRVPRQLQANLEESDQDQHDESPQDSVSPTRVRQTVPCHRSPHRDCEAARDGSGIRPLTTRRLYGLLCNLP